MKIFWTIAGQYMGQLWYFTGNIKEDEKPELSSNVHNAIEFCSQGEAEFGLFMLGSNGANGLEVQEHQIGW